LLVADGHVAGVAVRDRRAYRVRARHVVAGCGLAGTAWLEDELRRAGARLRTGPADFGIRLETTAAALAPFTDEFYDFKVSHQAAGISLRSFCVNGGGHVVAEYHRGLGIRGVNGHSYLSRGSGRSNLAILATITSGHHRDPKAYVRQLARQVNAAAGGYPLRQRLGELLPEAGPPAGVRPSNAKSRPGRLREILPAPLWEAFCSYIRALGKVLPPVLAADTVLYAPEIKYYGYQCPIDAATWESTDVAGLYVVGNAAGYTASLSAAALTGIIAADAITSRSRPAPPATGQK
jgi:uncharacterized FAD-dependent dehydrogenase